MEKPKTTIGFYEQKKAMCQKIEATIKEVTAQGKAAILQKLSDVVTAESGMSALTKKHVELLIRQNKVKKTFNEEGLEIVEWIGKE